MLGYPKDCSIGICRHRDRLLFALSVQRLIPSQLNALPLAVGGVLFCQQQAASPFMVAVSPFVSKVAVTGLPSGEAMLAIQSHGVSALDSMGGGRSFCPIPSYIGLPLQGRKLWFVGKRSRFLIFFAPCCWGAIFLRRRSRAERPTVSISWSAIEKVAIPDIVMMSTT